MPALMYRLSSTLAVILTLVALASCTTVIGSTSGNRSGVGHGTPRPHGTPGSPTPHPEHRVIVFAQGKHTLVALDAKISRALWTAPLDSAAPAARPAISAGLIVAAENNGSVRAFQMMTGLPAWSVTTSPIIALASDGTRVYLLVRAPPSLDCTLIAIDAATGHTLWQHVVGATDSSLLANGGTLVLVRHDADGASVLLSLDAANGTIRGTIPLTARVNDVVSASDGTRGYFACDTVSVCAVSLATGALAWRFSTSSTLPGGVVVADGTVFAGTSDGKLYALSADGGKPIFTFQAGGSIRAQPLVVGHIVYLVSSNQIYAAISARTGALIWHYAPDAGTADAGVAGQGMIFQPVGGNVLALDAAIGIVKWTFLSGDVTTVVCAPVP